MSCEKKETKRITEEESVIMAIVENGKILLEERTDPKAGYYGFTIIPGGRIKVGETPEEALIREVFEERSVKPIDFKDISQIEDIEDDGILYTRHIFLITSFEGEILNNESRNNPLWINIDKAYDICEHPISKKILDIIANEFIKRE